MAEKLVNVLYIPLESLHSQGDSLNFVFKKTGLTMVKKPIKIGAINENFVVVLSGLSEGEEVLLSTPEKPEKIDWEK